MSVQFPQGTGVVPILSVKESDNSEEMTQEERDQKEAAAKRETIRIKKLIRKGDCQQM